MQHHHQQTRNHSRQADAARFATPPAGPLPGSETDPVFAAAEAALFVPGDKAKLDSALQAVPAIAAVLASGNSAGQGSLYALEQLQLDSAGGRIAGNVQGGVGAQLEFSPPAGTPLLQIRVDPAASEPQRIVCDGGELVIRSTVATRIKHVVILPDLPLSDSAVPGQLWNDAGWLKVSAG